VVDQKFVASGSHFRHAGRVPASMLPQDVQSLRLRNDAFERDSAPEHNLGFPGEKLERQNKPGVT
jgi:hypothetical protein